MAGREIFCCKCDKRVGTIRDATLAKGITYTCQSCNLLDISIDKSRSYDNKANSFSDIFGDIWNTKYK